MNYPTNPGEPVPQPVLMKEARQSLSPQWGLVIGTYLVYMIVLTAAGFIPLGGLFLTGPMGVGFAIFTLKIARGKHAELSNIFDGFKHFANALIAGLLMVLIVGLGMFLLIIPGIIAALGLSLTFFILADTPEMSGTDALKKSWEMMKGRKGSLFILGLRFLPWALLCILTLGIGFLWLGPYMQVTYANFYDDVRRQLGEALADTTDDITEHLVDG